MPSAPDGSGSGRRIIRIETAKSEQRGEQRDDERHLQRDVPRVGVDPDDLGLHVRRLADEQLLQLRVGHDLGVVLEHGRDLLLVGRREHRAVVRPCA